MPPWGEATGEHEKRRLRIAAAHERGCVAERRKGEAGPKQSKKKKKRKQKDSLAETKRNGKKKSREWRKNTKN